MNQVKIYSPGKLMFGSGSFGKLIEGVRELKAGRAFVLTFNEIKETVDPVMSEMRAAGIGIKVDLSIRQEPSVSDFQRVFKSAEEFKPDVVIGIGGGSILDVSKLVAALGNNEQEVYEIFGTNLLKSRSTKLICIPTTSGTGSEMSPNAILFDENDNLKKGIVSPFLVPDQTYIDPVLTKSVPGGVTAATGVDAFTHCLEAYVNINSHPLVDTFALNGMRLIYHYLKAAVENGDNLEARSAVALGSMYGGMCLGPVNTTAIHALSYPLGSEFHIAHGLSNALLLTPVMEFNHVAAYQRYAQLARFFEVAEKDDKKASSIFIGMIKTWLSDLKIPSGMREVNIPEGAIPSMAQAAITVQRLLKNNPREVLFKDAINIYEKAY